MEFRFTFLAALLAVPMVTGCGSLAPTKDPARIVRGPLATRQQQPMALTVMAFRPRRPVTQAAGEFAYGIQAAWSSIEEIQRNPPNSPNDLVVFDGETVRTTFRTRYGLSDDLDIEIELPFLWAGGGGIDSFIEEFHKYLFLPNGGREKIKDDQFEMRVNSNGDELYSLEGNVIRLQDVPIFLTYQFADEQNTTPAVAARVGVELPVGSQERGFGNGAIDFGAGVIAEKSMGRWTMSAGFDFVFPGESDRFQRAQNQKLEPQVAMELGGEFRWNDHWSLVASTVWTSRMIDTIPLEEINREVFDLGVGFVIDTGGSSRLAFSIHEDLVAATGSDVTAQLGWFWGY